MKEMVITSLNNMINNFNARLRDYELQMAKIGDRHSELIDCRNQLEKMHDNLVAAYASQEARREEKK